MMAMRALLFVVVVGIGSVLVRNVTDTLKGIAYGTPSAQDATIPSK